MIQIKQRELNSRSPIPGLPESLSNLLNARGITSQAQLDYSLKNLLPPSNLTGINEAADLLAEAITADASIVIVGDFDVDGATSCTLAVKCLKAFGLKQVSYLVPNRFEYGYGLSPEIVGVAAAQHPDIIITVDNGISSIDGVHAAQALGMMVLITDHHLPGDEIPTADVIVNPNLPNDRFASKNLAGVGVIFYVMLAVRAQLRKMGWFDEEDQAGIKISEPNMSQFLDLVALGTVADVVPLDKNNRILVQQGLNRIRQGNACFGIKALLTVGGRNPARISSSDLGFTVGPRLNAAGRLDDMSVGIECLLAESEDKAMQLALQLDDLNKQRRVVEQSMQDDALVIVDSISKNHAIDDEAMPVIYVLYDAAWHQGVVGLVASRVKERVNRPVLALAPAEGDSTEWKGSMRSVQGVHIRDLLARVDALHPNLIIKFGGHAMAAGLSIEKDNIEKFKHALIEVAQDFTKGKDWNQAILTDGSLTSDDFTQEFADQLRLLTPWGQGFPDPVFDGMFDVVDSRIVGETHAKLKLQPVGSTQVIDAICFGYLNDNEYLPTGRIHAIYRLDVNEFRDNLTLQLIVQHIQPE